MCGNRWFTACWQALRVMLPPAKPANEAQRLLVLRRLGLLDAAPDETMEAAARCAHIATGAPMTLITLIDDERQFFMCRIGLDGTETPRELSFCAHAILGADPFIVQDALLDERFADNPFVTGPPYVRAYLGMPLITSDGCFALGTLCAVDSQPREWTQAQINMVRDLARIAITLIEMRDIQRDLREACANAA